MVEQKKPTNWRMFAIFGLIDLAVGLGLIVAGLPGVIGPVSPIFLFVGGVLAIGGAAIALFSRHKLSQAEKRRGELN